MKSGGRILIAAGGSGGHMLPAQALARGLIERGHQVRFAASGIESNPFFERDEFFGTDIVARPLSYRSFVRFMKGFATGSAQGLRLLGEYRPSVAIGFGSYHTVSILTAVCLKRIPLILHEANAFPGRVVRLFSRYALCTGCYFPTAQKKLGYRKTRLVDIPLRRALCEALPTKDEACRRYGFSSERVTILVMGGSQGAVAINRMVPGGVLHASDRLQVHIQVLHIAGEGIETSRLIQQYQQYTEQITPVVLSYEKEMQYAYSACDVAITRSGAGTIAELSQFKIPALFIPYPHAKDDHQRLNADAYLSAGDGIGEIMVEEASSERQIGEILVRLIRAKRASLIQTKASFLEEVDRLLKTSVI